MTFRKHEKFPSKVLKNERDLVVYLPPGYEEQASATFSGAVFARRTKSF